VPRPKKNGPGPVVSALEFRREKWWNRVIYLSRMMEWWNDGAFYKDRKIDSGNRHWNWSLSNEWWWIMRHT
jgi:hypothetical protein